MTQTNAHHARLLPQRTFGPLHQFRKFGDRRAGFRMCLEQLHIVLRILFALARRLLRHFMFSRMVVRSRSSTPNPPVKRADVSKMFGDDHCTWCLRWPPGTAALAASLDRQNDPSMLGDSRLSSVARFGPKIGVAPGL